MLFCPASFFCRVCTCDKIGILVDIPLEKQSFPDFNVVRIFVLSPHVLDLIFHPALSAAIRNSAASRNFEKGATNFTHKNYCGHV